MLIFQLVLVLVLVLLNGVFALAEMAVVSSRPARLKGMQERGVKGAGRALVLADDPGRFLSTVQVGITLVGSESGPVTANATVTSECARDLADARGQILHQRSLILAIAGCDPHGAIAPEDNA